MKYFDKNGGAIGGAIAGGDRLGRSPSDTIFGILARARAIPHSKVNASRTRSAPSFARCCARGALRDLYFTRCATERERSERERCASSRVPLAISRFFRDFCENRELLIENREKSRKKNAKFSTAHDCSRIARASRKIQMCSD